MKFSSIKPRYDLLVCGAGPGGLMATLRFLEKTEGKKSVALFDKRLPWREPVACAEAVHRQTLFNLLGEKGIASEWIRTELDGVDFVSPDGTQVRFSRPRSGLILDRARFHRDLAERCLAEGADCRFDTRVVSIAPRNREGMRRVEVVDQGSGEKRTVEARVVIDATGAGGRRWEGEEGIVSGDYDLESGAFALVKGLDHDPRFIQLHYGQQWAPGGYAWLFPRDGETVNVGVVVDRAHLKVAPPRILLERLLESRWKGAIPEHPAKFGGPIPCGQPAGLFGADGLLRVGDSASMVNPLSRGGILEAMKGGSYAAEAVADFLIRPGAVFEEAEEEYRRRWQSDKGEGHRQLEKAKKAFGAIDDAVLNRAAHRLVKISESKRSLLRIFVETLIASPLLLWRLRSLLR